MKTLSSRLFQSALLAVAILPNLLAQIPDWYATHKNLRFPAEMYLIGVGAGSGANAVEAAKKAAQTDLISQIRVQVQAQIRSVSESFQFNKDEQLFSEYRSNVRTAISDEITGMEVVETVSDKATGNAYALVVLDRGKYCDNLKNEMDNGWKQANELRNSSSVFAKRGKVFDATQSLLEARTVVGPLLTKQTLYNIVSNTPYKPEEGFGPATISSDIRQILSAVKLSKQGGDKQKGRIGESFQEPFVVRVTMSQDGKEVPVTGSTITFETSNGTKVGEATTDDDGLATFSTAIRPMTGSGLRARLSLPKLDREFEQNLLSSAVYFTWKSEASNVVFALKINVQPSKTASSLRNLFSSVITKIGYKVVSSSKNILEVLVELGQSNKVEGMSGTMYSVSANVIATLVDKEAENTLGSATFTGKALARSESEAVEKAVGNVKIDQMKLSELLEKAIRQ